MYKIRDTFDDLRVYSFCSGTGRQITPQKNKRSPESPFDWSAPQTQT